MEKIDIMYQVLEDNNLTSEDVLNLFTNWNGSQIITDDFIEFVENEGYYVEKE